MKVEIAQGNKTAKRGSLSGIPPQLIRSMKEYHRRSSKHPVLQLR
jgi:hypothetical protein